MFIRYDPYSELKRRFSFMINLEQLGHRICIIGISNSGKSTLASALSKKMNIPAYHLDQYAHIENSKWERQSDAILMKNHDNIIKESSWIIDGNYSICIEPRLNFATAVIWLDFTAFSSVLRYLIRSIKNDPNRSGRLAGAKNEFNFSLLKWIVCNYPKNRLRYKLLLEERPKLLVLHIDSMSSLKKYYKFWEI